MVERLHEVHVALPRGAEEPRLDHPSLSRGNFIMAKNIKDIAASVHQRLLNKAKNTDAPGSFEGVAATVKVFLEPIVASIFERQTLHGIWTAPGPWR
jgi:hypothetical protein